MRATCSSTTSAIAVDPLARAERRALAMEPVDRHAPRHAVDRLRREPLRQRLGELAPLPRQRTDRGTHPARLHHEPVRLHVPRHGRLPVGHMGGGRGCDRLALRHPHRRAHAAAADRSRRVRGRGHARWHGLRGPERRSMWIGGGPVPRRARRHAVPHPRVPRPTRGSEPERGLHRTARPAVRRPANCRTGSSDILRFRRAEQIGEPRRPERGARRARGAARRSEASSGASPRTR